MKYCSECGAKLDDKAKFCVKCGTKQEAFPRNAVSGDNISGEAISADNGQKNMCGAEGDGGKKPDRKIMIAVAAVILIAVVVAAVFLLGNDPEKEKTDSAGQEKKAAEPKEVEETLPAGYEEAQKAYDVKLSNMKKEYEADGAGLEYYKIDMDGDEIPELVTCLLPYGAEPVTEAFTYRDGKVVSLDRLPGAQAMGADNEGKVYTFYKYNMGENKEYMRVDRIDVVNDRLGITNVHEEQGASLEFSSAAGELGVQLVESTVLLEMMQW